MGLGLKNGRVLVIVSCISELFVIGLLIFSNGFLLTRQVVEKNSTCQDFNLVKENQPEDLVNEKKQSEDLINEKSKPFTDEKDKKFCWLKPTYKKAVIILIDALRYDFTIYNSSLMEAKPYLNKMPVFTKLLESKPGNALLLPFIADAPTTTMQRLKGLTTGSLPTFIDASHNFASEEISEDNIIDQLVKSGKKLTIIGDDTWGGLFPGRFHRSFFYPSFNVMDLHTVDDGILSHIDEELARDDWDIIITHFLGVDHCGHKYGPNHPEMAAKLEQMNEVVGNVAKKIDNNTLFLVFGDHGMTRTGDHGGDSIDEVTSALFMYSPLLEIHSNNLTPLPVAQVDLIPTLSLAIGVPIPYSNLGMVIEEVLAIYNTPNGVLKQVQALDLNARQVDRYLKYYKSLGNDFPVEMWGKLEGLHIKILDGLGGLSLGQKKQIYTEYLSLAKMMCEEVWAKFNVLEMVGGIFLMAVLLVLGVILITSNSVLDEKTNIVSEILLLTIIVNCLSVLSVYLKFSGVGFVAGISVSIFMYLYRSKFPHISIKVDIPEMIPVAIVLFICIGSLSNSYVIVENYVVSYLLLSVITVQVFAGFMKHHKKKAITALPGKLLKWSSNYCGVICMSSLLVVLACVRVSSWFWKCREEQAWCTPGEVHTPMSGLPHAARNWRYFTSLFSLILLIWLPRRWLLMCGNMNGTKIGVFLTKCIPVILSILVGGHWALQAAPALQNSPLKVYVAVPPLITYSLVVLSILTLIFAPLMIYEVSPSKKEITPASDNPYTCIPQLYQSLKAKYGSDTSKKQNIPIVYGLATAISAPLISIFTLLLITIVLLAGDGVAPGILILMIATVSCTLVQAATAWMNAEKLEHVMIPTWTSVCIWFIISVHSFYSTGHHPTFPSLHWSAAFVGFDWNWGISNVVPAFLVGFNTFSAYIIYGISFPLIVIGPLALGVVLPKLRGNRLENEDTRQGEFLFVEDPKRTANSLFFASAAYIGLHALKVFFSAVSALVLRRHLMVWKIFAPHFIFDALGFIVTCVCVPLGLIFTLRIISVLDSFSDYLRHKYS